MGVPWSIPKGVAGAEGSLRRGPHHGGKGSRRPGRTGRTAIPAAYVVLRRYARQPDRGPLRAASGARPRNIPIVGVTTPRTNVGAISTGVHPVDCRVPLHQLPEDDIALQLQHFLAPRSGRGLGLKPYNATGTKDSPPSSRAKASPVHANSETSQSRRHSRSAFVNLGQTGRGNTATSSLTAITRPLARDRPSSTCKPR